MVGARVHPRNRAKAQSRLSQQGLTGGCQKLPDGYDGIAVAGDHIDQVWAKFLLGDLEEEHPRKIWVPRR